MDILGRRRFLSSAVLGTTATMVAATTIGSVAPEAVADTKLDVEPGAPDPNFV